MGGESRFQDSEVMELTLEIICCVFLGGKG